MTYLKKAVSRARPDHDIFDTGAHSSGGVLIAVLALIFAPIILAHVISLTESASAQPPAAVERVAR